MLCLFVLFALAPTILAAAYSLCRWHGLGEPPTYVGWANYVRIASDATFWRALRHNLIYAAVVVPVQTALALVAAIVLRQPQVRGRGAYRVLVFVPSVVSPAAMSAVALVFVMTAGTELMAWLAHLGLVPGPLDLLGAPATAMGAVMALGLWLGLGFPFLCFLGALEAIDPALYEAARVDGAGPLAVVRHIILPAIAPVLVVVLLFTLLHSLRTFESVQVLTGGGPYYATDVSSTYIYRKAFLPEGALGGQDNIGLAAAAAFLMSLLLLGISAAKALLVRRWLARRRRPGGAGREGSER